MIFQQYLLAKLQRFRDYEVPLRAAQATEKIFGCRQNRKKLLFCFCNFVMLQQQQKIVYSSLQSIQKLNSFTNMVAIIDI